MTVKQRVAELMADGEARSARRISYLINSSYGAVVQLIRDKLLVKIGEMPREHPLQRNGVPIVVAAEFAGGRASTRPRATDPSEATP